MRDEIAIENCHSPIIIMEVFEQTQKRLEEIKPERKYTGPMGKKALSFRENELSPLWLSFEQLSNKRGELLEVSASDIGACDFTSIREDRLREILLNDLNRNLI